MIPRSVVRSVGKRGRETVPQIRRRFMSTGNTQSRTRALTTSASLAVVGAAIWGATSLRGKTDLGTDVRLYASTLPLGSFAKPYHDLSQANVTAAKHEFVQLLGRDGVDDTPGELRARSSTAWSPSPVDRTASLIVFPKSTEDVSQIMKICHRRSIPITPFSGGTSLDGALAATRGGICIDFRHLNQIINLHKDDLDVVVQAAVGWQELNEFLRPKGLYFPVDPGPGAKIGGMIATGCSGTNAYRYGPMKDWVISATIVLADGSVVKTRQRPRKSTAGYDLTRLIVSSSGTLGLVTEATLKLTAAPRNEQVAVVAFPSCQAAVSTVIDTIQTGVQTEALELLDEVAMRASNNSGYLAREYKEAPTLFIRFGGPSADAVTKQVSVVREMAKKHHSTSFESSGEPETITELWSARKTMLWNLMALKKNPDDKFATCDVAVPISSLAGIIEETNGKLRDAGLLGSCNGHVGDGNFHVAIFYGPGQEDTAESILLWCRRRGIEFEGTVTGEHGVGMELRDLVTEELGTNATDMMRKIKLALDPKCLLACDKVVRIEETEGH